MFLRALAFAVGPIPNFALGGSNSNHGIGNMTSIRTLIVTICMAGLATLAFAQGAQPAPTAPPPRVAPADAKNHVGDPATVCGKVVDTMISKYGNAGKGKPVFFYVDEPRPNPVFYFVAYGTQAGGPQEVVDAYQGKQVCVTGKITAAGVGGPFIMAADRAQIKPQAASK
jgi:hypothetical protein